MFEERKISLGEGGFLKRSIALDRKHSGYKPPDSFVQK